MKTLKSTLVESVKNETAKVLTVSKAKELKGKKISTIYFGYRGQDGVDEFIVGDIITHLEWARMNTNFDGYANQAEYWESYMSEKQLDEEKTTLCLLSAEGKCVFCANTKYWNFYYEPTFTGSDADREVYFIESTGDNDYQDRIEYIFKNSKNTNNPIYAYGHYVYRLNNGHPHFSTYQNCNKDSSWKPVFESELFEIHRKL